MMLRSHIGRLACALFLIATLPCPTLKGQNNEAIKERIEQIYLEGRLWERHMKSIDNAFKFEVGGNGSYTLYTIQTYTANLLRASHALDPLVLDRIAATYLVAFDHLDTTDVRNAHSFCPDKSSYGEPYRMWRTLAKGQTEAKEEVLRSIQFAYSSAYAINRILDIPDTSRTPAMLELLQQNDVISNDHLWRLIYGQGGDFQVAGWEKSYGCATDCYNHYEFLEQKLYHRLDENGTDRSMCNKVSDVDLWILATTAEMLYAHLRSPELVPLTDHRERKFLEYLAMGRRLAESRIDFRYVQDFSGNPVPTASFDDAYIWQNNTQAYAGDTNYCPVEKRTEPWVGWDISHARRFVHVFETFYNTIPLTGGSFPDEDLMRRLSNQYAYTIFQGDFRAPAFNNYFSGHDGWYRYNYSADGQGFGPGQMSFTAYGGGFGFWKKYNEDIERINERLLQMAMADTGALQLHRDTLYQVIHDQCETKLTKAGPLDWNNANEMLMFLPQLLEDQQHPFEAGSEQLITCTSDGKVYFNALGVGQGRMLFDMDLRGRIIAAVASADRDLDGLDELIVGVQTEKGAEIWSINPLISSKPELLYAEGPELQIASLAAVDMNQDGTPELIAAYLVDAASGGGIKVLRETPGQGEMTEWMNWDEAWKSVYLASSQGSIFEDPLLYIGVTDTGKRSEIMRWDGQEKKAQPWQSCSGIIQAMASIGSHHDASAALLVAVGDEDEEQRLMRYLASEPDQPVAFSVPDSVGEIDAMDVGTFSAKGSRVLLSSYQDGKQTLFEYDVENDSISALRSMDDSNAAVFLAMGSFTRMPAWPSNHFPTARRVHLAPKDAPAPASPEALNAYITEIRGRSFIVSNRNLRQLTAQTPEGIQIYTGSLNGRKNPLPTEVLERNCILLLSSKSEERLSLLHFPSP